MQFNRPPRFQNPLPNDVVKIPETPEIPSKPDKNNWLTILLPIGAILFSVLLMALLMGRGSSAVSYLFFLPIMVASSLAGVFTNRAVQKRYLKQLDVARGSFRQSLRVVEEQLSKLYAQEQKIRRTIDPAPAECLYRAQQEDSRLGERRPNDADFLHVRIGTGNDRSSFSIDQSYQEKKKEEFVKEYEFIDDLTREYTDLKEVPIHVRFPVTGSIGIAGVRNDVMGLTRAIISQLFTHYWVDEVQLMVVTSKDTLRDWNWLSDAPHLFSLNKQSKKKVVSLEDGVLTDLEKELQSREQKSEIEKTLQKEKPSDGSGSSFLPQIIIIFDYLPVDFSHPALNLMENKGKSLGIHGVYLVEKPDQIPGSSGGSITINNGKGVYFETGPNGYKRDFIADTLDPVQAEMLVRSLSRIKWPQSNDTSRPPELITFLEMFGMKRVEDFPLKQWWENESPYGFLRAPIGRMTATSNLIFDLNDKDGAHGPHGLLGGMTGSGKSEVLKTIILALAVTHHPYDLNFALIDFKGGAAFNELAHLPHTVGVVTDIESNATFAERVIQALSGEIERRKQVLEEAREAFGFGRSHIDEYRKLPVKKPMPRLIIIFDEFAEFKQRNPTESRKLISIARQGRSLGVHLILATQNISAAVDPEIMQNSNFRICLKVAEPQDSVQMVGIPDAINLTRGRAYFSSNTRVQYQAAFSGASYQINEPHKAANRFIRIWPDGKREEINLPLRAMAASKSAPAETEAAALVAYIEKTSREMHIKPPPAVWPDALPERIYLPDLLTKICSGGWDGKKWSQCINWRNQDGDLSPMLPVLGTVDVPAKQRCEILQMNAAQGGHLLVFGSAGTGKSTLLRTLVTSLALTQTPQDAQVYIVDYGGQSSLKPLEVFPHVGAVVTRLETERTERLFQLVYDELQRRNHLMREARVDNWLDYNQSVSAENHIPAFYLIIDGFREFKQSFEIEFINNVITLLGGSQAAGLFLVISASLQNDIPNDLFANINMRCSLIQADSTEYFRIVGAPSESKLQEDAVKGVRPGRGLIRGTPPLEIQIALPTYGETEKQVAENLLNLAEQMRAAWNGDLPEPVLALPNLVTLPDRILPTEESSFNVPLGLSFSTLAPIGLSLLEDGPTFMVGGTTGQCGKTTLLRSWILSLSGMYPYEKLKIILIDFHTRTLNAFRERPNVSYVGGRSELDPILQELSDEISSRHEKIEEAYLSKPRSFEQLKIVREWQQIVVVIDDYEKFYQSIGGEAQLLTDCLRGSSELGVSYIIAAKINDLPNSYSDRFIERFRKSGCGVLLGGVEGIDEYNNTRRPAGAVAAGLPPGRGFLVHRGKAEMIQVAAYWDQTKAPEDALRDRIEQIDNEHNKIQVTE